MEEKKHSEEIQFLKRTNQQLKVSGTNFFRYDAFAMPTLWLVLVVMSHPFHTMTTQTGASYIRIFETNLAKLNTRIE